MRLEPDEIDIPTEDAVADARKFVDGFWDGLRKLVGTGKGKVIDITNPEDDPWPSTVEIRSMSQGEKVSLKGRVRHRFKCVRQEIERRAHGNFRYNYNLQVDYIGNGRIVVWWKFVGKKYKYRKEKSGGEAS